MGREGEEKTQRKKKQNEQETEVYAVNIAYILLPPMCCYIPRPCNLVAYYLPLNISKRDLPFLKGNYTVMQMAVKQLHKISPCNDLSKANQK